LAQIAPDEVQSRAHQVKNAEIRVECSFGGGVDELGGVVYGSGSHERRGDVG
jgi:hypothetical protein